MYPLRQWCLAGGHTALAGNDAPTDPRQQQGHLPPGPGQGAADVQHQEASPPAQQKQTRAGHQAPQNEAGQHVVLGPALTAVQEAAPASSSQSIRLQGLHAAQGQAQFSYFHQQPPEQPQQQLLQQQQGQLQQPLTSWGSFERSQQFSMQLQQSQHLQSSGQEGNGQQGVGQQGVGPQGTVQQGIGPQQGSGQPGIGQQGSGQQGPATGDEVSHMSGRVSAVPQETASRSVGAELHAIQQKLLSQQQRNKAEGFAQVICCLSHAFHDPNH